MSMIPSLLLGPLASPSKPCSRRKRSMRGLAWRVSLLRNTYVRLSIQRQKLLTLPPFKLSPKFIATNPLLSLWTLLEVQRLHRLLLAMWLPPSPIPVLQFGRHSGVHTGLVTSLIRSLNSPKGITLHSSGLNGMGLKSLSSSLYDLQWLSEVYSYQSSLLRPLKISSNLFARSSHSFRPQTLLPRNHFHS